jgi:phage/plasmid-associated DNA primase
MRNHYQKYLQDESKQQIIRSAHLLDQARKRSFAELDSSKWDYAIEDELPIRSPYEENQSKQSQDELKKKATEVEARKNLRPRDDMLQPPIHFKDAVGRKFSFPWHMCKTWEVVWFLSWSM